MPRSRRPVLIPAGFKHPRVRELLAVKRHPASRGRPGAVALEGRWLIGRAMAAGVRLEAVVACPALLQGLRGWPWQPRPWAWAPRGTR